MMTLSPTRQRLVDDHGISPSDVMRLVRIGRTRARCAEHECNGDPHVTANDPSDKNENAELWGRDVERNQQKFREIAERYGLVADFGIGLYPHLQDAKGRYVEIPY